MSVNSNSSAVGNNRFSLNINDSRTITSIVMIAIIIAVCLSAIAVEKYWNRPIANVFTCKRKIFPNRWFSIKRRFLLIFLLTINICAITIIYLFGDEKATITIVIIAKAKDILCTVVLPFYFLYKKLIGYERKKPLLNGDGKLIVSIIPVYKEKLEEIIYTMDSIIYNSIRMYQMLVIIICDGSIPDVNSLLDGKDDLVESNVEYRSWKGIHVQCQIVYGYRGKTPLVIIKKGQNMEKRDSLILAYDIFNQPRHNADLSCLHFRTSVHEQIKLLFQIDKFDYLFFTDADSFIEIDSLTSLIDELEYRKADAACGLVMVDFEGHWGGFWNIYQNFQYIYGQFVRRCAENMILKVTCLPGCITMVKPNSKLLDAITDYGTMPIYTNLVHTTIQRLGTDRRLTHLFQRHQLRTCMVDSAVCYTKPPQSWYRLLTQRRRWGSNAFFNSLMNVWSRQINPIVRISAFCDLMKMSLVFFRLYNIGLFICQLTTGLNIKNFLFQLIIIVYPRIYFIIFSLCKKRIRMIMPKILIGFICNTFLAGLFSTGIMATVFYNIGNFAWGPGDPLPKKEQQKVFTISTNQVSNEIPPTNTLTTNNKNWPPYKRILPL